MVDSAATHPGLHGSSQYDLLDRLAEEFIERYRRGERPSLREYTDRHPGLAEEIRDLFPALVQIEQVEGDLRDAGTRKGGAEPAPEPIPPPRRVGDFEIIREVGRGGMGVVYEADQVSLGRRVALKIMARAATSDANSLGRFRREARAAARLHHTNIVPVYEVGQEGDVFYYAMQFIEGQGLDLVIAELRRIRDIARREGRTGRRADTIASAAAGRMLNTLDRAGNMQASQVARLLLTGQFAPGAWADDGGGAAGGPEAGPDPYATPAPTMLTGFQATEVIEAWPPDGDGGGDGEGRGETPARPTAAEPSSSGLVSAAGLLSGGESRRRPYYLGVARIGRQAAEAMAYAHERGIIHRDIKPSNLLLDKAGVIWITDFGLAKADDDGLTHTGDVIGTFRYMAPERFRGQGDERADVYALGLTLYELLVLRPAFLSADRLRLMEKIKNEEPARPRLADPSIPRDLETIVLKAIEKDPRRRFASAAAMAEDLRRFIDDEPIQARRTGTFERMRLWCRRNQAKASLLAALAAAVSVAFVAVTWALFVSVAARRHADERAVMEHVARQQAESALRQVETQQKRADDNFARAMAVGDSCLALIGESEALQAPGFGPLRRELLRSALRPYQELVRDRGDDPTVRAGLAAAHLRVGKIHSQLGEADEARLAAAQAIRLYRALAAEYPEDREISAQMAESYAIHGDFRDASRIAARLLAADPADPRSAPAAAEVCLAAARHFEAAGSPVDAPEVLRPALEFREAQVRDNPDDPAARSALARVLDSLGVSLASRGRNRESLEVFRRAVIHARAAHTASPRDLGHGRSLATALHHAGLMERRAGRDEDAARSFAEAIDVREPMADGNPAVPSLQAALCHEYACLAASRRSRGREDEAERSMLLARGVIERLPDRGGNNLFVIACVHARLAAMAGELGSMPADAARAERRRRVELAIDALRRAVAADYDDVASFRTNPDLAPLRDYAEFQAMLARLEESARARGPRPGRAKAGD